MQVCPIQFFTGPFTLFREKSHYCLELESMCLIGVKHWLSIFTINRAKEKGWAPIKCWWLEARGSSSNWPKKSVEKKGKIEREESFLGVVRVVGSFGDDTTTPSAGRNSGFSTPVTRGSRVHAPKNPNDAARRRSSSSSSFWNRCPLQRAERERENHSRSPVSPIFAIDWK